MRIKLKAIKKRRFVDSQRSFREHCNLYSNTENPRKYFRWQKIIDREKLMQSLPSLPASFQPALNPDQTSSEGLSASQRVSFVKMHNLTQSTFSKDRLISSIFERREVPSICLSPSVSFIESTRLQLEPEIHIANSPERFCEEIIETDSLLVPTNQNNICEEKQNAKAEENHYLLMNTADSFCMPHEISFAGSEIITSGRNMNCNLESVNIIIESPSPSEKFANPDKEAVAEENADLIPLETECEPIQELILEEQQEPETTNASNEENLDLPVIPVTVPEINEASAIIKEVSAIDLNPVRTDLFEENANILCERGTNIEQKSSMELENNEITPQKGKNAVSEKFLTRSFQRLHGLSESIHKSINELNEQLTHTKNSVTQFKNSSNSQISALSQESLEIQNTNVQVGNVENKQERVFLQNEENQEHQREIRPQKMLLNNSCQKSSVKPSANKDTPSSSLQNFGKTSGFKLKNSTSKCGEQSETTPIKKSEGKIPWSSQTEAKVKLNKAEKLRMEFIKKKSATVSKDPPKNARSVEDLEKGWSFGKSNLLI